MVLQGFEGWGQRLEHLALFIFEIILWVSGVSVPPMWKTFSQLAYPVLERYSKLPKSKERWVKFRD